MGARGIAIIDPATGGNDEVYGTWYECPHCKNDNILNFFKFCPDCGIKLDMSVVEEKRRKGFGVAALREFQ